MKDSHGCAGHPFLNQPQECDVILKNKITYIYNRLDIKEIKEVTGYHGDSELLRKRILNGTISPEYEELIISLLPTAKASPLVTKEQNKNMVDLIQSIGYRKFATFLGEKSKNFNMEIYGYCGAIGKMMSIFRYEYLKRMLHEYLVEFKKKCYLL